MVQDATEGERLIAVALLQPGWEQDYEGSPAFHRIGTVGRIEDLVPLPDGRFLFRLIGLQRVEFFETVKERPYRMVRARPLAETTIDESSEEIRDAKLDLLTSQLCLQRELSDPDEQDFVLDDSIPFEAAVNGACANLPVEPSLRQSLLSEDDLLERRRRVFVLIEEMLQKVLSLKALRTDGDPGRGLN